MHFGSEIDKHVLNKSAKINIFDDQLKSQVRVIIIDQVEINDLDSSDKKLRKIKEREAYWQNQLRTFADHGGLNKRDARKETKQKSYSSETS